MFSIIVCANCIFTLYVFLFAHFEDDDECGNCHNLNFVLATKARACEGANQEGSPRITSHAFESAGECEGMNIHTPK
jgi:hypothetical protein